MLLISSTTHKYRRASPAFGRLTRSLQKGQRIDLEAGCETFERTQREISLPSLEPSDVRPVHVEHFGKRLLRQALLESQPPQVQPDTAL